MRPRKPGSPPHVGSVNAVQDDEGDVEDQSSFRLGRPDRRIAMNTLQKSDERTLWRLRLVVARAAQDCGVMHHQLHDLGALIDSVIERGAVTDSDLLRLDRLSKAIAQCADDCARNEHCDFVRADLVCELRELDARLRDTLYRERTPVVA